jgi:hypothetical protein
MEELRLLKEKEWNGGGLSQGALRKGTYKVNPWRSGWHQLTCTLAYASVE